LRAIATFRAADSETAWPLLDEAGQELQTASSKMLRSFCHYVVQAEAAKDLGRTDDFCLSLQRANVARQARGIGPAHPSALIRQVWDSYCLLSIPE
jgi:hypothetical protein